MSYIFIISDYGNNNANTLMNYSYIRAANIDDALKKYFERKGENTHTKYKYQFEGQMNPNGMINPIYKNFTYCEDKENHITNYNTNISFGTIRVIMH